MCDPSLTRAILSALEASSHEKARYHIGLYKCPVFNFFINLKPLRFDTAGGILASTDYCLDRFF